MGSNDFYPEERPVRIASVGRFLIDRFAVTNSDFARFVADTGYVTTAEIAPSVEEYPHADPDMLRPGSAVFVPPGRDAAAPGGADWWKYVFGACWQHPEGPESTIEDRLDHPVVHISFVDAISYANWCGKSLPTEAEWEFAARGGLVGAPYAWGRKLAPDGKAMANYWIGSFPRSRKPSGGRYLTTPVASYPANGFGLHDMVGNVWEWTSESFTVPSGSASPCCGNGVSSPKANVRVIKGGSYLCAENYCRRYRPAARHRQEVSTTTAHLGFRCVVR